MRKRVLALAVIALAIVGALAVACSDKPVLQSCKNVPDGGCPLSYGLACDDPSCNAAYACLADGTWQLDHTCPPRDAAVDVAPPVKDAGVKDVDLDVPGAFGGPGCNALEAPDCPYGLAAQCPNGCCDCEDLFVCRNGGWDPYATCIDGAITK
ncbi:hypothetical protein BH09MYX1_BH09MYX1_05070 [soil metagenome]